MRGAIATAFAAMLLCAAAPAFADESTDAAFGSAPPAQAKLADAQLRDLRGKFVPPSSGAIVYFGLDMSTAWTTSPSASNPATYQVDAHLGFDLSGSRPAVTLSTSSARSGGANAADATQSSGSVAGTVADGRANGLLQSIAIAGSGNSVENGATLDVSSVRPIFVVTNRNGAACGAACTVTVDPSGIRLGVALPSGSASQTLGPSGIAQSAQVTSNFNTIKNALGIALQVGHTSGAAFQAGPARLFAPIPTSGMH